MGSVRNVNEVKRIKLFIKNIQMSARMKRNMECDAKKKTNNEVPIVIKQYIYCTEKNKIT